VGNIKTMIDRDLNPKYHLFSNLFITDIVLILLNSILYFSYRFSEGDNYKNDYLYNDLNYQAIDYAFMKNIYDRTSQFYYEKSVLPTWYDKIKEWFIILYPLVFLFILIVNIGHTFIINIINTINGLFTDFFNTIIYIFKLISLVSILAISCIILYLSTTISTVHLKTQPKGDSNIPNYKIPAPASALNNNGIFSHIEDLFHNLNMNYLTNSKVSL
jgi:hypothetical protein